MFSAKIGLLLTIPCKAHHRATKSGLWCEPMACAACVAQKNETTLYQILYGCIVACCFCYHHFVALCHCHTLFACFYPVGCGSKGNSKCWYKGTNNIFINQVVFYKSSKNPEDLAFVSINPRGYPVNPRYSHASANVMPSSVVTFNFVYSQ